MDCPVCAHSAVANAFRGAADYLQCNACGFLWRVGRVESGSLNRVFGDPAWIRAHAARESRRAEYFRCHLERLQSVARPPGRLLEAGCGTGEFLRLAKDAGWDVCGIELSPGLCQIAREKVGPGAVLEGDVANVALPHESFDCVVALDLIEHVPDPWGPVRRFQSWLRPGGYLVLQTPNARSLRRYLYGRHWNLLAPDRHVIFHSPGSLEHVLRSSGFTSIAVATVSGRTTDRGVLRAFSSAYGGLLARFRLGNGLWCAARKNSPS